MITKEDVRLVLADCSGVGLPAEIGLDTPIVVDSFALIWIKHVMEERHGVVIEPDRGDLKEFHSVNGIHTYLLRVHPDQVTADA